MRGASEPKSDPGLGLGGARLREEEPAGSRQ